MRRKVSRISSKANKASRLSLQQRDWKIPYNLDNFVDPLNEGSVVTVHNAAMKIVEEIGILFLNQDACKIFKKLGVKLIQVTQK